MVNHRRCGIGVFQRMRKNKQKNCGHKYGLFCVWWPDTKKIFDQKEIKMKMPSLLNVSSSSSKPEYFSFKDIEVFVDIKREDWFKRAYIGQYLGIARISTSTTKLAEEDIRSRTFLQSEEGIRSMDPPREDAQDHDIFILLTGTLYVLVNSRKDQGKAFKEHILKDIVPRGFDARIEEIQEKH